MVKNLLLLGSSKRIPMAVCDVQSTYISNSSETSSFSCNLLHRYASHLHRSKWHQVCHARFESSKYQTVIGWTQNWCSRETCKRHRQKTFLAELTHIFISFAGSFYPSKKLSWCAGWTWRNIVYFSGTRWPVQRSLQLQSIWYFSHYFAPNDTGLRFW